MIRSRCLSCARLRTELGSIAKYESLHTPELPEPHGLQTIQHRPATYHRLDGQRGGTAMALGTTAPDLLPHIASGAQVEVRDEEWLVRAVQHTPSDGLMVRCIGTSTFVRDLEATFFTNLDRIEPLRPRKPV